eukprot:m.91131 g.91131  ORF g.91131 m.91131 type:complete len:856 (+) comp14896_c0_seq1:1156-3723(+)
MRRIKLNSKYTFPLELDMTPFMPGGAADGGLKLAASLDASISSNTDAAAAVDNKATVRAFDDDTDEEAGTELPADPLLTTPWGDDTKARDRAIRNGMVYELFSVLIHSGSALGGHYYAYIKDLETDAWHCFNDSSVTATDLDSVRKAFGGTNTSRYGGAYASSASAYMLLYRRIEPERNQNPPKQEDLPPALLEQLAAASVEAEKLKKAAEAKDREIELNFYYSNNRVQNNDHRDIKIDRKASLQETLQQVRKAWEIPESVPDAHLKVFRYTPYTDDVREEIKMEEEKKLEDVGFRSYWCQLLLMQADEDGVFEDVDDRKYRLNIQAHRQSTDTWEPPYKLNISKTARVCDLANAVAEVYGATADDLTICKASTYTVPSRIPLSETSLASYHITTGSDRKLFVELEPLPQEEALFKFDDTTFFADVSTFLNSFEVEVELPDKTTHSLVVDSRNTWEDCKKAIQAKLLPDKKMEEFQLWYLRYTYSQTTVEVTNLRELLRSGSLSTQKKITVKFGRALQPGDHPVSFRLYGGDAERSTILLGDDVAMNEDSPVKVFRAKVVELIKELKAKRLEAAQKAEKSPPSSAATPIAEASGADEDESEGKAGIPESTYDEDAFIQALPEDPARYRLWEISSHTPSRPMLGDESMCRLYNSKGFGVQLLPESGEVKKALDSGRIYFYRRWHRDQMYLGPIKDIYVPGLSVSIDALKLQVAELEDMDPSNVGIAPVPRIFPYSTCPTEIEELSWDPKSTIKVDEWPMNLYSDGAAFYLRDNTAPVKELAADETKALEKEYNKQVSAFSAKTYGTHSNYYNRPEKGVVIKTRAQRKEAEASAAAKAAGKEADNGNDADDGVVADV